MQLILVNPCHVRLRADDDVVVVPPTIGAVQLLAGSLALCVACAVRQYATVAQFRLDLLEVDVSWNEHAQDDMHDLAIMLRVPPSVTPSRYAALLRIARQCPVSARLRNGVASTPQIMVIHEERHVVQA